MAAQEDKLFEAKIEDCLRLGEKRPAFLGFWIFPSARTQKNICAVHMRKITDFLVAFPKRSERFWACFRIIWSP